jgi:hypothetical protein
METTHFHFNEGKTENSSRVQCLVDAIFHSVRQPTQFCNKLTRGQTAVPHLRKIKREEIIFIILLLLIR